MTTSYAVMLKVFLRHPDIDLFSTGYQNTTILMKPFLDVSVDSRDSIYEHRYNRGKSTPVKNPMSVQCHIMPMLEMILEHILKYGDSRRGQQAHVEVLDHEEEEIAPDAKRRRRA
jgi:hypothetical protein